ncbi:MAG: class I SAM-dependent methyltransferase [Proteobacteria bacterium]|nr:class I SAM-dependent methyltransferase [Pseudomonadota bacterium]
MSSSRPYPTENHEALAKALRIGPKERVLEVGGGHNPFFRADVIVDIDFVMGEHRDGVPLVLDRSKHSYVQADISALPFPDKCFDVVLCIHVLEHVRDPSLACRELMRVARRGFLETPRKWTEYYAGHPAHKWVVDDPGGALTFEPILYENSPFLNFALPAVWSSSELFENAAYRYRDISCVQFQWEGEFVYDVKRGLPVEDDERKLAARHYGFARNLLYWNAEPERGIFHAAHASTLQPSEGRYRRMHAFYLAMCGRWREALKIEASPGILLKATICLGVSRISRWLLGRLRKIVAHI